MALNRSDSSGRAGSSPIVMTSDTMAVVAVNPAAVAARARFCAAQPRLTNRWWSFGSTAGHLRAKSGAIVILRSSAVKFHGWVLLLFETFVPYEMQLRVPRSGHTDAQGSPIPSQYGFARSRLALRR